MNTRSLRPLEVLVLAFISAVLVAVAYWKLAPFSMAEALGFASGGVCVWLVVRQNIWNWPIGILNNIAFFYLFFHSRLYADMGLQVVYLALGVYGWIFWLRGGPDHGPSPVYRTTRLEWIGVVILIPLAVFGLRELLIKVNGSAPFWDALSTVLSLAAQFLLSRKRLENWFFWIAADLIYIPLYISKDLYLTAALYSVFLFLCILGYQKWRESLKSQAHPVL